MPGQHHDDDAPPLIEGIAFDGNDLVAESNDRGAKAVIFQHVGRARMLEIDDALHAWRRLIETLFCKLK